MLLHDHADFAGLIQLVASERGIDPALVERLGFGCQLRSCIRDGMLKSARTQA